MIPTQKPLPTASVDLQSNTTLEFLIVITCTFYYSYITAREKSMCQMCDAHRKERLDHLPAYIILESLS